MKGSNSLTLNRNTILQALQEYFDKRTVGGFDECKGFRNVTNDSWELYVEERKDKK